MAARMSGWDGTDAEQFIRELFEHVLRMKPMSEKQIEAWTKRALDTLDPVAVFRAMINLPAHQQQLLAERDSQTRWPPGHFFSPLVARSEVIADRDRIFAPRPLHGVDLRGDEQLALLKRLAPYIAAMPFPEQRTAPYRYCYHNPSYGYGDAAIYFGMINHFRPSRILEVGSGFSSALALDTVDALGLPTVCTFIDPFPKTAEEATDPLRPPHSIIPKRVQDIDPNDVKILGPDDILFIDSTHVLKTGSDVHFEITEMLPRVRPGVLVHVHDIFSNFE
jgi:hypothetical protein